MYNENELVRIKSINKKLDNINTIITRHNGIVKALEDIEGQPALLMLLVAIAEQFSKLQKSNAVVLNEFSNIDLKGIVSVRNFVAHDYDGVNFSVIEDGLRYEVPKLYKITNDIVGNNSNKL